MKTKKKIILISPFGISNAGGVERVMLYVKNILISQGYEIDLLDREFLNTTKLGRIFNRKLKGSASFFWRSLLLSWYAARRPAQAHTIISNGYAGFCAKADIVFCHGSMRGYRFAKAEEEGHSHSWKLWFFSVEELMEYIAAKKAKYIIAVSPKAAEEWVRYYKVAKAKVHILPNPVDVNHFTPHEYKEISRPHKSAQLRILFVGRLEWRKGIDRILTLAQYCELSHIPCSITLVSPSEKGFEKFVNIKNVCLHKNIEFADLPKLYNESDILYFPSRYEGFEMVTLEALSCGIPVAGTRVGAIGYLIEKDFPGVYEIFPDKPAQVYDDLTKAAKEWSPLEKKIALHRQVAETFGLEQWGARLLQIMGELDG